MNAISTLVRVIYTLTITVLIILPGCGENEKTPLPCLERAAFGDPSQSPYILPYPVEDSYRLMQGYCYQPGSHFKALP